jgi:predicted DNA-binding transcriptional regulator YafY
MRILLERTDENNALTARGMIDALAGYDIPADRKSIYDDVEVLRQFGVDVAHRGGKDGGYFVASRDFELPELKLLVDAVQSSRFITGKKSKQLIDKISKLTSVPQAKQLNRQVFVAGRAKSFNETVYYNVDAIYEALSSGAKISFKYFNYSIEKKPVYRKNGERYVQTPVAMTWSDDNYYLIVYNAKYDGLTHYRVDRMSSVEVSDEPPDTFDRKSFNAAEYSKRVFGMYNGELVRATIAFDESLVSVALDHFGGETHLRDLGDGRFSVTVDVSESPVFLGWIFQLGGKAEILAPESLRDAMRALLATSGGAYAK